MEILIPEYFDRFRCIAADCPDSCCKEWEVDVDAESARMYRQLPGALGARLREVLREYDGGICMTIQDGRCPMWRQDGLCRIQAELGHEALCRICREYPRLYQDYGDFAEYRLEMSCPEAARLIFTCRGARIVQEAGGEAEYDPDVMALLRSSREKLLAFWQEGGFGLAETLAATLLYAHTVQEALDGWGTPEVSPEACVREARRLDVTGELAPLRDFYRQLEILTEDWRQKLEGLAPAPVFREALRPLGEYLIGRYWLQAVWDLDLVSRAKFLVSACILVSTMGGEPVRTAQLFSKEIENDADNLDKLLDAAYTCPAFTDANLLGLLIGAAGDGC